jgi:hypothetical protein
MAGDDPIAEDLLFGHPKLGRAMCNERIELDERARIEKQIQSLSGRQLSGFVLSLDTSGTTPEQRLGAHLVESTESLLVRRHSSSSRRLCAKTQRS